jgi:hypothetical protein
MCGGLDILCESSSWDRFRATVVSITVREKVERKSAIPVILIGSQKTVDDFDWCSEFT